MSLNTARPQVDPAVLARIRAIIQGARSAGRDVLLETEGMEVLKAIGISVPDQVVVQGSKEASALLCERGLLFPGEKIVVKAVSDEILHKSELGAVAVVSNTIDAIIPTLQDMESRLSGEYSIAGYSLNQFISYPATLGSEFLIGMRWTDDFGPVVSFGPGGIYTEFLSRHFKTGSDIAILSPYSDQLEHLESDLNAVAVAKLATGTLRGQRPRIASKKLAEVTQTVLALAAELMPADILEFEVNPLVVSNQALYAVDVLIKLAKSRPGSEPAQLRPLAKIRNLLEPKTAAIAGVSEKLNPGRIILENLICQGFDRSRITIVKPGTDSIQGCRCVPDVSSIPERVDLLVLAISAAQVPAAVVQAIRSEKAESIIIIPGGLEEKAGGNALVAGMQASLKESRSTPWGGPVINGGNCLGILSRPGKYNTLFIPDYKLPLRDRGLLPVSPVALVSQSGAFAISRLSKLAALNPKYAITIGNQMDLTIGDFLTYLKDDPELEVFAVYVEGFKELDGLRFLAAAREITRSGRKIVLYRSGRTAEGAQASASHTASIAGNYAVTRALCERAGVTVAESISDFEELTKLFTFLRKKSVRGTRLGAVSNAGFECVSFADNLGSFSLPAFEEPLAGELRAIFTQFGISSIVDLHNPIDLTPMTNDEGYEAVVRAMLNDASIDAAIVGCVPLTAALATLPSGPTHGEDLLAPTGVAARLGRLFQSSEKPWIVVVDSGALFDPFVTALEAQGIPTFRAADQALKLFNAFCRAALSH